MQRWARLKIKLRDERGSRVRGCGSENDGRSYDDVLHRVTRDCAEASCAIEEFPERHCSWELKLTPEEKFQLTDLLATESWVRKWDIRVGPVRGFHERRSINSAQLVVSLGWCSFSGSWLRFIRLLRVERPLAYDRSCDPDCGPWRSGFEIDPAREVHRFFGRAICGEWPDFFKRETDRGAEVFGEAKQCRRWRYFDEEGELFN